MSNENQKSLPFLVAGQIDATYLNTALESLSRSLKMKKDEFIRDSCIQRFEYSIELLWKTLKKILELKGYMANSPRDTFRLAAKAGLIEETKIWFDFLEMRNNTSHTYKEAMAEEIYQDLPAFLNEALNLLQKLKTIEI